MKLNYYADTDSLYIDLSSKTSTESKEIADGVVVDFDQYGAIVGIDIEQASKHLTLTELELNMLPLISQKIRA